MIQSTLLASAKNIKHGFLLPEEKSPETYSGQQVHKASWLWIPRDGKIPNIRYQVDALGTAAVGTSLGVYSADCVPILVAALGANGNACSVLAIHAGWRGTAQRIAERVLRAWTHNLLAENQAVTKVLACIGPCIHKESFEVGAEVPAAFPESERTKFARFLRKEADRDKFEFDLVAANQSQIQSALNGIALELEIMPQCTFLDKTLPSYRRDGKNAGRILSTITLAS